MTVISSRGVIFIWKIISEHILGWAIKWQRVYLMIHLQKKSSRRKSLGRFKVRTCFKTILMRIFTVMNSIKLYLRRKRRYLNWEWEDWPIVRLEESWAFLIPWCLRFAKKCKRNTSSIIKDKWLKIKIQVSKKGFLLLVLI